MTIDINPEVSGGPHFGDYYFEVSRGSYAGIQDGLNFSGYQTSNTLNVEADIWGGVVGNLTWLQTASVLEVLSDSLNDTSNGTGARTIAISGLDGNLNPISEVVTMNGTTPVQTVNSYFRLLRGFVSGCGTYNGSNIGNITVRVTAAGSTQGYIPAGNGRIAKTHYTIPTGKKLLIRAINMVSESNKPTTFKLYIKGGTPTVAPFAAKQLGLIYSGIQGGYTETFIHEIALTAGTDLWATATPSANNVQLSLDWEGVLVNA